MNYGNTPHNVAVDMANTFEEHSMIFAGQHHITETGWDKLSDIYGKVLPEMRASVFNDFMKELTKRNIAFNTEEFQDRSLIQT